MEDVEELCKAADELGDASDSTVRNLGVDFGVSGGVNKEKGDLVSKSKHQAIDADIKAKMPEACQPPYMQDTLFKFESQATYSHVLESSIIALPFHKISFLFITKPAQRQ